MSAGQKLKPLFEGSSRVHDFYYDVETGVIYFRKSIEGKIIKFSTSIKVPNILAAKRFANSQLKKRLNKRKNTISTLVGEELDAFLKVKESENLKPDTLKNIRNGIKRIRGFWGDRFPYEITSDNIPLWIDWLRVTYPGEQKENAIKIMRTFTRYLTTKLVNGTPLLSAAPPISDPDRLEVRASRKKKKEFILDAAAFKKIYDAGQGDEKLIALFMYTMASRIDETLKLKFDDQILLDVEPPLYRWSVGQNKANLTGEHALHPSLIEPLRALREARKQQGTKFLFPQATNLHKGRDAQTIDFKSWRDRAQVGAKWTSHTFRHSCLSYLFADENNPQMLICKLYRVSLAVAFETYIKPTKSGILKMQNAMRVEL